jgi:perosamine synthetase
MPAERFAEELARRGVETRPFFLGMHEQPVFRVRGWFAGESFPVAERLAREGVYLPSGTALTTGQQSRVIDAVKEVLSA